MIEKNTPKKWPVCVVPVKPFSEAKTRLADTLSGEERAELSRMMLLRTVRLLVELATKHIGRNSIWPKVLVVCRDRRVLRTVKAEGAWGLLEIEPGLNNALTQAMRWVEARGGESALVLPADLPLLDGKDVEAIVRMGQESPSSPSMVIAPCRHGEGTNALLLRPPCLIPLAYGEKSFARHCELARRKGIEPVIYRAAGVGLDIDFPADLALYRSTRRG